MFSRSLILGLCILLSLPVPAKELARQRQLYDEARQALDKGDSTLYVRYAKALRTYPLESYLAYDELTSRLKSATDREVEAFLQSHSDLPQINWMKLRWLRLLAERGEWSVFDLHYQPGLFDELDCLHGQSLLAQNRIPEAYAMARQLWLVGRSQPKACDPLFDRWQADGQLSEALYWRRLKLAVEARDYGLANYLVKNMNQRQAAGRMLIEVAQRPQTLGKNIRIQAPAPVIRDIVTLGLQRLASQDPEQTLNLLKHYTKSIKLPRQEQQKVGRTVSLVLARRFDERAPTLILRYDPLLQDQRLTEWYVRLLLRHARWADAYRIIQAMPEELAGTTRWRYWKARTLQLSQPDDPQIKTLYQALAGERDFYGFLAADQIGAPYQLNNHPVTVTPQTTRKVRNTPGIRRSLEFKNRGQIIEARREWFHASRSFSRDEQLAQARLAYEMQWYFPAIRTLGQAEYWDDLEIRFPLAYRDQLSKAAREHDLHSSWVFAIARQESAFMADARSHAGAMGLMQLMPATARETARKFSIPLRAPQQALQADTNIKLGTAYLSRMYAQFNGNRILASAAYNAGPNRVRQWLADSNHLTYDVWIENIPFDETRKYVQNVLTYAVIYGTKLDAPHSLVGWHERYFDTL